MELKSRIEREFLPFVIKPGQYIGNELGAVRPSPPSRVRLALAVPRTYSQAATDFDLQSLYGLLNSVNQVAAERFFLPELDAQKLLREKDIPLFSMEGFRPLSDFDCLILRAVSPLEFPYMLQMLDLGGLALPSTQREGRPLVLGWGEGFINPEPMEEFLDGFMMNLSAETVASVAESFKTEREKTEQLVALAGIGGVYVPGSVYVPAKGSIVGEQAQKILFPLQPVVPYVEIEDDKLCIGGGTRLIGPTGLLDRTRRGPQERSLLDFSTALRNSGYEKIYLDLRKLDGDPKRVVKDLEKNLKDKRFAYEVDNFPLAEFDSEVADILTASGRNKLGFQAVAPSQRLRDWLGEKPRVESIENIVQAALEREFQTLALRFVLGLPTETEDDLLELGQLLTELNQRYHRFHRCKTLRVDFKWQLPVPNSVWQWDQLPFLEQMRDKMILVKLKSRTKSLKLNFPDPVEEYWKGIMLRGDGKAGQAVLGAYRQLSQGQVEQDFKLDWAGIFQRAGLNPQDYARAFKFEEKLPGDFVIPETDKERLRKARTGPPSILFEEVSSQGASSSTGASRTEQFYGRKPKIKPITSGFSPSQSKIRMKWIKTERVRFNSHLDVVRMFEKAIRRADFPVAFSEGFHPHPKIAYGPPLTLGFISDCELVDMQLEAAFNYQLIDRLNAVLPEGFSITEARPIFSHSMSLSSFINASIYEVYLDELSGSQVERLLQIPKRSEVWITRKSKQGPRQVNLAGLIHEVEIDSRPGKTVFKCCLGLGQEGYARPQEVLQFGLPKSEAELAGLIFKRVDLLRKKGEEYLAPLQVL